jgi:hypothetical protein
MFRPSGPNLGGATNAMVRTALEQSFAHARTVFGSAADAAQSSAY